VNRLEELISTVECKVSLAMNELLLAEYTEEEVTTALNQWRRVNSDCRCGKQ
jgi:hypothetical protein